MKFNHGKPYHGSSAVQEGKLKGETDTDYFYFICPNCTGKQVLQIPEYAIHEEAIPHPYNESSPKLKKGFTLAFKLLCPQCNLTDFVKIGNLGLQGGQLPSLTNDSK